MKRAKRKAAIARTRGYIASLVPLFYLQAWQITVEDTPPDAGDAACWTSDNCWLARLRFSDKHFRETPEEQANTAAHELIHIVASEQDGCVRDIIASLDPTARAWATERYDRAMERATDHLARILTPHLPLPPTDDDGDWLAVASVHFVG